MKQSILVVDDDEAVRALLVESLADLGYDVAEAADGPGGLRALGERAFDLVLVDYAMPLMCGAALVEEIRKVSPAQKLLLVSGYAQTLVVQSAAADIPILGKPFRPEQLRRAIEETLLGR